jgi:hypothetical protein
MNTPVRGLSATRPESGEGVNRLIVPWYQHLLPHSFPACSVQVLAALFSTQEEIEECGIGEEMDSKKRCGAGGDFSRLGVMRRHPLDRCRTSNMRQHNASTGEGRLTSFGQFFYRL